MKRKQPVDDDCRVLEGWTNDTRYHVVDIRDPDACAIAHIFLPPNGTQVSGEELEEAVRRLVEAANAIKRARLAPARVQ